MNPDCMQSRLRPKLINRMIHGALAFSLPLVLAACSGNASDTDRGGDTLPPEPLLMTTWTVPEEAVGADTWFRYGYIRRIDENSGAEVRYFSVMPISESGTATIRFDADVIEAEIDAGTYFRAILPTGDDEAASVPVVDNPDVLLKPSSNLLISQQDPAATGVFIDSHTVQLRHFYTRDNYDTWASMRPIFADDEVRVSGTISAGGLDHIVEIDLERGWNLLYTEQHQSGDQWTLTHRAKTPEADIEVGTLPRSQWLGSFAADYDANHVSMFTHASLNDTDLLANLGSWREISAVKNVLASSWLQPSIADRLLRPFAEVLEANPSDNTILGTDDLSVTLARVVTHPENSTPYRAVESNGEVRFTYTAADFPVFLLYADRSAQIFMDNVSIAEGSQTMSTEAGGLDLDYGWNLIAVIPVDNLSDTFTLTRVHPDEDQVKVTAVQH